MAKIKIQAKAIIFDMDGVITNTMPDHYRAWHKILKEEGIDLTHREVYIREGQPGKNTIRELFAEHRKPYHPEDAKSILLKKEHYFKKIVHLRFIVGARTLLKELAKCPFQLALVTGTSRHEAKRILPKSLYDLFLVTVTGDEVRYGKPHPEPYIKAAKELGCKTSEAVAIENAPFGIQSAKAAGLRCLALETSLSRKYLKEADWIFSSIREMKSKVHFES